MQVNSSAISSRSTLSILSHSKESLHGFLRRQKPKEPEKIIAINDSKTEKTDTAFGNLTARDEKQRGKRSNEFENAKQVTVDDNLSGRSDHQKLVDETQTTLVFVKVIEDDGRTSFGECFIALGAVANSCCGFR